MELLLEGCVALLAVLGLTLLGVVLFGRLLRPVPGDDLWAVVPGRGGGEELERDLRALIWLRGVGLLRCSVAIVDAGLTAEGRELALRLASRWPEVVLWPAEALGELLDT